MQKTTTYSPAAPARVLTRGFRKEHRNQKKMQQTTTYSYSDPTESIGCGNTDWHTNVGADLCHQGAGMQSRGPGWQFTEILIIVFYEQVPNDMNQDMFNMTFEEFFLPSGGGSGGGGGNPVHRSIGSGSSYRRSQNGQMDYGYTIDVDAEYWDRIMESTNDGDVYITPVENTSGEDLGKYMSYGMVAVNTSVGIVSDYMVYQGAYHKWNNVWHKTKTAGTAWCWQTKWNNPGAIRHRNNQLKTVAKPRSLSTKLSKAGGVLIIADIGLSGELKPSHVINAALLAASSTGVGTLAAGIWFIADFGTMGVNYIFIGEAKGIGDIIDNSIGTVEMWEGVY